MVVSYGILQPKDLAASKSCIQEPGEYSLSILYFEFKGRNPANTDFIR